MAIPVGTASKIGKAFSVFRRGSVCVFSSEIIFHAFANSKLCTKNRCPDDSSSTFSNTLINSNQYWFRLKSNQFHSKRTWVHFHIKIDCIFHALFYKNCDEINWEELHSASIMTWWHNLPWRMLKLRHNGCSFVCTIQSTWKYFKHVPSCYWPVIHHK